MNKKPFTHYAWFCHLPVYFNVESNEMAGRFWLADVLIVPFSFVDGWWQGILERLIPNYESAGFAIKITGEIAQGEL